MAINISCSFLSQSDTYLLTVGVEVYSCAWSHSVTHSHSHHTRYDTSRRVISPTQRSLPDKTQHSQRTDIRVTGGIRTHSPNSERPQTDVLERAASGTGKFYIVTEYFVLSNSAYLNNFYDSQSKRRIVCLNQNT
jgi:hypothetical protein